MRQNYSYFITPLLLFFLSGCSSNTFSKLQNSFFGGNTIGKESSVLSPLARVSEGVITKVEVKNSRTLLFGYGKEEYNYKVEVFLDDGRVFTTHFRSNDAYFRGDRVRVVYRGKTLDSLTLLYRN